MSCQSNLQSLIAIACIPLICLILSGCQTNATPNCAGWEKITIKSKTAAYLAGNDLTAGQGIASHNKHGRNLKCWN